MNKEQLKVLEQIKAKDEHPERGSIALNNIPEYFYRGNQENGLFESWHPSGQFRERSNYKDGKLDGLYEEWHPNGQLRLRCTYKNGKRDGLHEEWHPNGQLRYRYTYKDGKLDGLCEAWHFNGQPIDRYTYKDGKQDGLYEAWYPSGQLRQRSTYKDDNLDGPYEAWHENGQLRYRYTYKNGERDGISEEWNKNGQLIERLMYKAGTVVERSMDLGREFREQCVEVIFNKFDNNFNNFKEYSFEQELKDTAVDALLERDYNNFISDGYLQELNQHGCISGMEFAFLYTSDNTNFVSRNLASFLNFVSDLSDEFGSDFSLKSISDADHLVWTAYELYANDLQNHIEELDKNELFDEVLDRWEVDDIVSLFSLGSDLSSEVRLDGHDLYALEENLKERLLKLVQYEPLKPNILNAATQSEDADILEEVICRVSLDSTISSSTKKEALNKILDNPVVQEDHMELVKESANRALEETRNNIANDQKQNKGLKL